MQPLLLQEPSSSTRASLMFASLDRKLSMMRKFYFAEMVSILIILGMLAVFFTTYASNAPRIKPLVYQARLTDADYVPVADGARKMKFRVWTHATSADTGTYCKWATGAGAGADNCTTPVAIDVTVSRGVFSVLLGAGSANNPAFIYDFNDASTYIDVQICNKAVAAQASCAGADYESLLVSGTDRQRISAVPYAMNAQELAGIAVTDFPQENTGRAGGRIVVGGTAVTDDLVLKTTSAAGESGADMIFKTGNNGATEAMRILYNGRVGIGTITPSTFLHVSGGSSATNPAMIVNHAATYTTTGNVTGLLLNADRAITVNDGGIAAVTTVIGPVATFQDTCTVVSGTCTSAIDVVKISQLYASNSGAALNVTTAGTGVALRINDDGTMSDTTPFVVSGTGTVGMGTAAPDYALEVSGATTTATTFALSSTGVAHTIPGLQTDTWFRIGPLDGSGLAGSGGTLMTSVSDDDTTGMHILGVIGNNAPLNATPALMLSGAKSNGAGAQTTLSATQTVFQILNDTLPKLTMLGSGYIGINTITPGAELDVKGTIRFTNAAGAYVGFTAPGVIAGSLTYTLPAGDGTNGQALTTNGAGVLSWTTVGGGGSSGLAVTNGGISIDGVSQVGRWNTRTPRATTITSIDTVGDVGLYTSLTIGTDGLPVITYYDTTNGNLKIAHCTNATCTTSIITTIDSTGDVGIGPSIMIGTDGFPIIAYRGGVDQGDLKVAHCTNITCTTSTVVTVLSAAVGRYATLSIGTDGFPIIAYLSSSGWNPGGSLAIVHCTNTACTTNDAPTTITATNAYAVTSASIAIGSNGYPIVSYGSYIDDPYDFHVVACSNIACTASTNTTLDTLGIKGSRSSITIGDDGFPIISYYADEGVPKMNIIKCVSVGCTTGGDTITTVDATAWLGDNTISIGKSGFPIVAYFERNNNDLKLALCKNTSCTSSDTLILDSTGTVGDSPSLAFGADGLPVISYYDTTNGNLKVLKCGNDRCINNWTRR